MIAWAGRVMWRPILRRSEQKWKRLACWGARKRGERCAAHQLKVPVFVKPKTSRLYAYRGARAIVCNAKEAGFYVTRSLGDEKSFEEAGHALLAHFGCGAVVITRGEKGMNVFEESSPRHLHIPATGFEVT